MSFILPETAPIRDAADHPCLKADEALKIAQALAADPAQPFLFNTNCGHRAQLMIGRLVENGFPLDLIYHAESHAIAPAPNHQTIYSHRHPAGATFENLINEPAESLGIGSSFKTVASTPSVYPVTRDLSGTDLKIHFLSPEEIYVWDSAHPRGNNYKVPGYEDLPPGFALRNDAESQTRMEEHHTIAIPVLNEETGLSELKIIDPHLTNPIRLISFHEWKNRHDCDSLVMLSAAIGQRANIVMEEGCLGAQELQKLQKIIEKYVPDQISPASLTLADTKKLISTLDDRATNKITIEMLKPSGENMPGIELDEDDLNHVVDWHTRSAEERQEFIDYLASTLEPLTILEKKWKEKFSIPAHQNNISPSPQPLLFNSTV